MTRPETADNVQSPSTDERKKLLEALRRSVPITRMTDYGVPLGDALRVHLDSQAEASPSWDVLCERVAATHLEMASDASRFCHPLTAQLNWRAAASLLQCAQLAFNHDTKRKIELYAASRSAMGKYASTTSSVSELVVPTAKGALYGWIVRPASGTPQAAVLILGGLSGWGSVYLDMAQALASRGILAILGEGPGQGFSRMRSGLRLDIDTLPLFSRLIDAASLECGNQVGVWGNSFGGLFAAHLAASDMRVKAVCINGAPTAPEVPAFRTAREQMQALFGVNEAALRETLARISMHPGKHEISADMLVVEGGKDSLVPLGAQGAFLELGLRSRSRLLTWADGEHTIYNHAAHRNAQIADWFQDCLLPHPPC
jgi:alpha-beta hydrolase superfamily lysophospholipase